MPPGSVVTGTSIGGGGLRGRSRRSRAPAHAARPVRRRDRRGRDLHVGPRDDGLDLDHRAALLDVAELVGGGVGQIDDAARHGTGRGR